MTGEAKKLPKKLRGQEPAARAILSRGRKENPKNRDAWPTSLRACGDYIARHKRFEALMIVFGKPLRLIGC